MTRRALLKQRSDLVDRQSFPLDFLLKAHPQALAPPGQGGPAPSARCIVPLAKGWTLSRMLQVEIVNDEAASPTLRVDGPAASDISESWHQALTPPTGSGCSH